MWHCQHCHLFVWWQIPLSCVYQPGKEPQNGTGGFVLGLWGFDFCPGAINTEMFPFVPRVLQWTPVVCLHVLPARGEQRVHERGDRPAPAHLPDHRGAHPHGPVLPLALPRYPASSSPGGRILLSFLAILIVGNITCQANQSFHFHKNSSLRTSVRPCHFLTWSLCESYVDANTEFIWFRTHSYIGNYLVFYFKNQGWVGMKT